MHTENIRAALIKVYSSGPLELQDLLRQAESAVPAGGYYGVVVSAGRLPPWAFAALVHHYCRQRPRVAVVDPQRAGAVVVESRVKHLRPGDVISVDDAKPVRVEVGR